MPAAGCNASIPAYTSGTPPPYGSSASPDVTQTQPGRRGDMQHGSVREVADQSVPDLRAAAAAAPATRYLPRWSISANRVWDRLGRRTRRVNLLLLCTCTSSPYSWPRWYILVPPRTISFGQEIYSHITKRKQRVTANPRRASWNLPLVAVELAVIACSSTRALPAPRTTSTYECCRYFVRSTSSLDASAATMATASECGEGVHQQATGLARCVNLGTIPSGACWC